MGHEVDWATSSCIAFSIALDSKYRIMIHFNGGLEIHAVRPQLDQEVDLLDSPPKPKSHRSWLRHTGDRLVRVTAGQTDR